jgi:hypothetical protein
MCWFRNSCGVRAPMRSYGGVILLPGGENSACLEECLVAQPPYEPLD